MLISISSAPTRRLSSSERKSNLTRKPRKQSGVIPYRVSPEGDVEILLVSSSHSGKWGIPKGGVEPNMTKRQSAVMEAMEEAGLKGKATDKLGVYSYIKGSTGRPQKVTVYAFRVKKELDTWLEAERRTRKWFKLDKARKKLPSVLGPMLDKVEQKGLSRYLRK